MRIRNNGLLLLCILLFLTSSCTKQPERGELPEISRGNTTGNASNGGMVCQQGDWIYYYLDNSTNHGIYKIRTNGTEGIIVIHGYADNINVGEDGLYYIGGYHSSILKLAFGKDQTTVICNDIVRDMSIVEDWIYFNTYHPESGIFRIRTDGTKKIKLTEDTGYCMNVTNDWVYYIDSEYKKKLYKMRVDGTERMKVCDDHISFINVVGDWIYYTNPEDSGRLYKMRTDGTDKMKITEDIARIFNVSDSWVYYRSGLDHKKLYKIRIDGTDRTKLMDDQPFEFEHISVVEDWVYCHSRANKVFRVHTDGTEFQLVD
ncbi:MAG: DUF5050 domain-containing protein [Caldisericia bacterium]|nr:DUF5050 domain-containing protein [Caldisericia bacterium]